MPRKPLIYTSEFPYHVTARSNNKEWFYLPISECWRVFTSSLVEIHQRFGFEIHAFVLMSNHYHLLGQCSQDHDLGEVMAWFQKSVSRQINKKAGRINHIFGGAYKASLISHDYHYSHVYKYIARNPVTAGLSETVENYPFSSFNKRISQGCFPPILFSLNWRGCIPKDDENYLAWLNTKFNDDLYLLLKKELKKTVFEPKKRGSRRDPFLTQQHYQK
ncbi:transposase [Bdellovibrio bacteriovorus]|uniref:transposase n=1 Tax=Bdellovibrio TaxID=958 RepID=UPI0035A8536C